MILKDQGKYANAIQDYTAALKLTPTDPYILLSRAVAYQLNGNLAEAQNDFNQTLRIKPDYAEAYYYRSLVSYDQKKWAEALADAKQAATLQYPVPQEYLNHLNDLQ